MKLQLATVTNGIIALAFLVAPTVFADTTISVVQRIPEDTHDYNKWDHYYDGFQLATTTFNGVDTTVWTNPYRPFTGNQYIVQGNGNGIWSCNNTSYNDLRWVQDYAFHSLYLIEKNGGYVHNYPTGVVRGQVATAVSGNTVTSTQGVTSNGSAASFIIGDYKVWKITYDYSDFSSVAHADYNNIACGFEIQYHSAANTYTPNPSYLSYIRGILYSRDGQVEQMSEEEITALLATGNTEDGYNLPDNITGFLFTEDLPDETSYAYDVYNASSSLALRTNAYNECAALDSSIFEQALCRTSVFLFTPTQQDFWSFFQGEWEHLKAVVPFGYFTLINQQRRSIIEDLESGVGAGVVTITIPNSEEEIDVFNLATVSAPLQNDTGDGSTGMEWLQTFINFAMGLLLLRYVYVVAMRILRVPTVDETLQTHKA